MLGVTQDETVGVKADLHAGLCGLKLSLPVLAIKRHSSASWSVCCFQCFA